MSPSSLNAHERPPERIRQIFKRYQKAPLAEGHLDANVVQTSSPWEEMSESSCREFLADSRDQRVACEEFVHLGVSSHVVQEAQTLRVFEIASIPGQQP